MNKKARDIKEQLLEEAYKYESSIEQEIPLDEDGFIIKDFLSYVSLNSVHKLLSYISRDVSKIIVEKPEHDREFANVFIESSFYLVPVQTMDDVMGSLSVLIKKEMEEVMDEIPDDDLNITA